MATRNATMLLVRDELVGFARSRVMLVLWIVLPAIAMLGYFLLPDRALARGGGAPNLSATGFMALIESSLAGTVAALMVAVDIVSERNRKVYELLVIRPIRREAIVWAKFIAVFACVSVACVVSLGLGIAVDAVRGDVPSAETIPDLVESLVSLIGVIALSAGVGVFFGVVSRSILVAVILVLYLGQNLAIVPMLPVYLGVLPESFWLFMSITLALVAVLVFGAGVYFRRSEL